MGLAPLSMGDEAVPNASVCDPPAASPFPAGMSARERMAARLAASRGGSFALAKQAYDAACRAGKGPREAQLAADEAARQAAGATSDSQPSATTAAAAATAAPLPSHLQPHTPMPLDAVPSSLHAPVAQQPNAVPPSLSALTRAMSGASAASAAASSSGAAAMPASCSRSEEEWAARDAQFMSSMCWGVASAQGERAYMEDEHRIVQHFDSLVRLCNSTLHPPPAPHPAAPTPASSPALAPQPAPTIHFGQQSFFGVYDGHGGREAAEFVRDHLHINIAKRMAQRLNAAVASGDSSATSSASLAIDLGEAMKQGTADTEKALLRDSIERQSTAGAVVAFTIISGMQVYVAHAGDSRAVLCRDGRAMDLTQDHKPGLESEQSRVAALGGFISDGCVNGEIGVSRALGDVNLSTGRKMLGLSADISLSKFYLSDEDEFLIIACDGLWDVMSSSTAVAYARHCLMQHNDIQRCANELVQQALRQHSTDNVSCVVVGFTRTLERPQDGDGELRVIVPRPVQRAALGARPRAERVVVPPRPKRLQLNSGGLSKLMQALKATEPTPKPSPEPLEEEEEEEADGTEEEEADSSPPSQDVASQPSSAEEG